jgi:hypothetical protein
MYIFLGSCNYIPCSSSSDLSSIKEQPDKSLIVGVYFPDKFTKEDYKEYINSDSTRLILTDDGEIFLNNFPIETFAEGTQTNKRVNGRGSWKFKSGANTLAIETIITFDQKGIFQPSGLRLFKKGVKYYILIDFGDPDNCSSVRLEHK